MVDSNEFVELQQGQSRQSGLKLATVSSLTGNSTAIVTFFGETVESQKGYSYLSTYKPSIGDIALMVPFSDTYIIVGKLMLPTDIPTGAVTYTELTEALSAYATTEAIAGFVTSEEIADFIKSGETVEALNITTLDATNTRLNGTLLHKGTALAFFNGSASNKQTVTNISASATLTDAVAKLNALIDALQSYNFI